MGGCLSQQNIDSQMVVEREPARSNVRTGPLSDDVAPTNVNQLPAQGGTEEYVGAAYMKQEHGIQNYGDVMSPDFNIQTEEPLTAVPFNPSDIQHNYQNVGEQVVAATHGNTEQNTVQPLYHEQPVYPVALDKAMVPEQSYQTAGEAVVVATHANAEQNPGQPLYHEQPVNPVSLDGNATVPAQFYQNMGEQAEMATHGNTGQNAAVQVLCHQPVHPVSLEEKATVTSQYYQNGRDQVVMEAHENMDQNAVGHPLYREQPVHPVSLDDKAPPQLSANLAGDKVQNAIQRVKTQQNEHSDFTIVFEGQTFRKRVFDENFNGYVYVTEDNIQPNGGLLI